MRTRDFFLKLLAEPLLHFALAGVVLVGLDSWSTQPSTSIAVTHEVKQRLADDFAQSHGQPPDASELDALIDRWIREEILYREGVRLGLDRQDRVVRDRVASQMAYVLTSELAIPEPTNEQLDAWFDAHHEDYAQPGRVDFTQVFVDDPSDEGHTRAEDLLRTLERGADPAGLGDRHAAGRRLRGRKPSALEPRFGTKIAEGLRTQKPGQWWLESSADGWHAIRIDRRLEAKTAALEQAREQVRYDWRADAKRRALEQRVEALEDRYEIEKSP